LGVVNVNYHSRLNLIFEESVAQMGIPVARGEFGRHDRVTEFKAAVNVNE